MLSNQTKGINLAIVTALISGVSIFVNKCAVDAVQPPLFFTAAKNAGVALLILGILLASRKWHQIKKLKKGEFIYLLLIGIIGGSLPFYLYFTGLSQIPAVNAALIHKTLVLWVALLAVPFLKEKMSKVQIAGVLLLFSANFIIGGFKGFQFSRGELFVLIATILWAVENILAKKILPRVDPDLIVAARMGVGAVVLLSAVAVTAPGVLSRGLVFTPTQWFWMILTVALLLGYVMSWYRALKFAPAVSVTSVLVVSTLVTNALSAIFITHSWNVILTIQSLLMMLGMGILWLVDRKRYKVLLAL